MNGIKIDGITYRVRVVYDTLKRGFTIVEGGNSSTTIAGRSIRDILGTGRTYTLNVEPDPAYPEEYDKFYEIISSPNPSHFIEMPYAQRTETFEVQIKSGTDSFHGKMGGFNRWTGLTVTFEFMEPKL